MVAGKESGCCQKDPIFPPSDSPLPFPDSGMLFMSISISQIYVTQSRPLARMKG